MIMCLPLRLIAAAGGFHRDEELKGELGGDLEGETRSPTALLLVYPWRDDMEESAWGLYKSFWARGESLYETKPV